MTGFLANRKIMHKVLAVLLLLGAVTVGLAAVSATRVSAVDASYGELVNSRLPATINMVRTHRIVTELVETGRRATSLPPGSTQAEATANKVDEIKAKALKTLDTAVQLDPSLTSQAPELRAAIGGVHQLSADGVRLAMNGDLAGSAGKLNEADRALEELGSQLVPLNDGRIKTAEARAKELTAEATATETMTLSVSLLAILLGTAAAYWVVRTGITAPISDLEGRMRRLAEGDNRSPVAGADRQDEVGAMARALEVFRQAAVEREGMARAKEKADAEQKEVVELLGVHLSAIAGGDLTQEISAAFPPEYQALKTSMNQAINSLRDLLAAVSGSAAQIRTGSSEIAQASEDLARRTEGNAASLEQTSAAIVQMDGRLKATASAAGETVGRADQAIATVSGGRSVAEQAVQAMSRVSDSAQGIDSVIEGLDKIAFQTRVLAMNAAVEAGRAGDAGRGFAVVADLVSALAMRAEEEAKRARGQLTVTQTDISTAVEAVQRVDGALQNISADVTEVHHLLASIASDNQAQAAAITEISAAVSTMDQATQQNAAMVEETSAAARNLLGEVTVLSDQASAFRVDHRSPAPSRAGESAPAQPVWNRDGAARGSAVKPLPAAAIGALTRPAEAWREF